MADEEHGIKSASLLSRADLLEKLGSHYQTSHGVELSLLKQVLTKLRGGDVQTKEEKTEDEEVVAGADQEQMVIQSAEGKRQVVIRGQDGSMIIQDIGDQEHAEVVTPHQGEQYIVTSEEGQVITGEEIVTEYQDPISTEDEEDLGQETESSSNDVGGQMISKTVCHAYVIAKTVKEFRDLGRDMLRIHAENHGIEHASKLRLGELVREMVQHYNGVHNAGMEVSKLDMLKLNMLTLKKVKIDMREKTPPPDITKMIPKNVVPIEEQVHHVYEKRPDICTVDIIVNNLKDMLALGTSILRPEASKHRVCNSSRKQKLQVKSIRINKYTFAQNRK